MRMEQLTVDRYKQLELSAFTPCDAWWVDNHKQLELSASASFDVWLVDNHQQLELSSTPCNVWWVRHSICGFAVSPKLLVLSNNKKLAEMRIILTTPFVHGVCLA